MYAYPRNHQCPSPINNLPIELLSYIFSLSTYPSTTGYPDPTEEEYRPPTITTESVQVPLVLSSVSQLWRQVALGTPHLWSSLCITVELVENFYSNERDPRSGFTKGSSVSRQLNTSHITSYLALSRKYPLNILIDARDENWNFEPELVSDHGEELYTPAFTSKHMNIVFTLLLPHLSRWKSLSILTDCWAPMYTALTAINPFITRFGAPLLESLSLMRCNDLISFSPLFQPQHLKEPEFLNRGDNTNQTHHHHHHSDVEWCCPNMIPSLKYLSLRGVHVDWDALGDSLSTSETGLTSLELASHSHDVRPSPEKFYKILCSSSGLRNLVLSASGPSIPEDAAVSSSSSTVHDDYVPAHLPHLRNITIGYRMAVEGRIALGLIDAPNTKELVLEDVTYVGDPDVINAGPLLSYIGTRQFGEAHQNHRITASSELTTTTTLGHQAVPLVVAEKPVRSVSCVHVNKDATESRSAAAAFPLLESVTLRGVKTCSQPLRVFLGSLSNLQHLELTRMSMQAIHALLPSVVHQITTTTTTTATNTPDDCYTTNLDCPCPQLRSLCIRSFEQLDSRDLDFIIGSLPVERQTKGGACQLREVDIHVDAATATCVVPPSHFKTSSSSTSSSSPSMKVNIINDISSDEDEGYGDWDRDDDDDDDDDYEYEYEGVRDSMGLEDPYEPGGAFNDPLFDEYYSLHFQTVRQ